VLVPVRTEQPSGYAVAFAAPASGFVLNQENAEVMLAALDLDDARVEISEADSEVEYRIAPLEDSTQLLRLIAVLDSLGSRRVRSTATPAQSKTRTIWQLLLNDSRSEFESSRGDFIDEETDRAWTIDLNERLKGDFVLWMPVGDQPGDTLRGLLLDRQGDKTNGQIVGDRFDISPDDCGWHQYLNNSELHTRTPDGEQATFYLYRIEDVRKLEKMGYNFATMEFDIPRRVPITGMGPKLNEIKPNPSAEKITIEYMVPQAYEVELQVLDEYGREIRNLLHCMPLAGIHHVTWDGLDADGNLAKSGTYLCRFIAGDYMETHEFIFER
jgi:hypothetical protein